MVAGGIVVVRECAGPCWVSGVGLSQAVLSAAFGDGGGDVVLPEPPGRSALRQGAGRTRPFLLLCQGSRGQSHRSPHLCYLHLREFTQPRWGLGHEGGTYTPVLEISLNCLPNAFDFFCFR